MAGTLRCNQNVMASAEVCNSLDNNCNGQTDEGNPGGGLACSTGQLGVCAAGTTTCSSGAIRCNQNVMSSAEVCDGLDNNCNGTTDEGNPGGGVSCNTGLLGVCSAGTTACTSGSLVCNENVGPSAEVCDGKDNNCNGATDEGNPGGGAACNTGLLGVCAAGTTACTAGAIKCNENVAPSQEICDGLDNDCDGRTDLDAYVNDGIPNSCANANQHTVSVAPNGSTTVTGVVDPNGDDYFEVFFTGVGGPGTPYHPIINLTNTGGGQYTLIVREGSCAAGADCGGATNTVEYNYTYPAGTGTTSCVTTDPSKCVDSVPRVTTFFVQVHRLTFPTTCSQYTVTVSN
jgi:hypothetical protein